MKGFLSVVVALNCLGNSAEVDSLEESSWR